MKTQYFKSNEEWENWLSSNHIKESELWLIYYKKHTKKPSIPYEESVETALCFGWIDSLIKKIDEDSYARKFNVRNAKSLWSESNKKRINELIRANKMHPAGIKSVEIAKQNGYWDKVIKPPELDYSVSGEFQDALNDNPKALNFFESLPNTKQKQFTLWINMCKRQETRQRRINESIQLLSESRLLGLR